MSLPRNLNYSEEKDLVHVRALSTLQVLEEENTY